MRPSPRMPTTLSCSSTPVNADRFHCPAFSEAAAWGTLRATDSRSATACSAALTMLELGAFTTITPALVAASTSTLSRPTPARATTRSLGASRKRLGVDRGRAADDDRVRVGERRQQRGAVRAVRVPDLEVGLELCDGRRGELLGDQDDGCRHGIWPLGLEWVGGYSLAKLVKAFTSVRLPPAGEACSRAAAPLSRPPGPHRRPASSSAAAAWPRPARSARRGRLPGASGSSACRSRTPPPARG